MRVLDLFSGIGAYSLGLERSGGFQTVAFCEIDEYPRRILRKHWPDVPIFEDVRALTGDGLRAAGIVPDWIVAGWPCQGNSPAGTGLGMDDPRSGLWSEIRRLASEIRPLGLLLENSSNLLAINGGDDFGRVLGDLASLGYDAEWHCLPAAAFDAPHIRDRLWIIATRADAQGERCHPGRLSQRTAPQIAEPGSPYQHGPDAHADGQGLAFGPANGRGTGGAREVNPRRAAERVGALSDAPSVRRPELTREHVYPFLAKLEAGERKGNEAFRLAVQHQERADAAEAERDAALARAQRLEGALRTMLDYYQRVQDSLGEAVHTGLRKGVDGKGSAKAWHAIADMEDDGWSEACEFARCGLEYGIEREIKEARQSLADPAGGNEP